MTPQSGPLDRLEPFLSERNLDYHIHKIQGGLRTRLERLSNTPIPENAYELARLITKSEPGPVQNLSMELFNHQHYWESLSLRPGPAGQALLQEAEKSFGSFELLLEGLRQQFEAMNPGWLYLSHGEHLRIGFADHPLLSGETMLLCIDGWEHAYYLDYQHRRMDYLQALLLKLVDWAKVNQRLLQANKPGTDSLLA